MDAQLNETFDMIGYASALGEKGYAQLKKDLNAKTDVWTDLALAPNNQYGTVLLSFISQVNLNPLNALASIILLSYQAMNMTPNIAVHELFIRQVRILVSHVDDSVKKDYEKFKGMFVAGNDSFALICSKIADGFGTNELQRQQTASPEVYERVSAMMLFVMEKASEVSSPRPNCLTVAHCHFMQLCAQQRRYNAAVKHVEANPIYEIDPPNALVTPEQYLQYWYYGATCLVAMRKYKPALEFLHNCITVPSHKTSAITLSAVKMAHLVSLIHSGESYKLPNGTSTVVTAEVNAKDNEQLLPYMDLSRVFTGRGISSNQAKDKKDKSRSQGSRSSSITWGPEDHAGSQSHSNKPSAGVSFASAGGSGGSKNAKKGNSAVQRSTKEAKVALREIILSHTEQLEADNLLGLAMSLEKALSEYSMRALTNTYITLSLADIALKLDMQNEEEVEQALVQLVAKGKIKATIDQQSKIAHFQDGATSISSGSNVGQDQDQEREMQEMMVYMDETTALDNRLRDIKQRVLSSKSYVQSVSHNSGPGGGFWGDKDMDLDSI